MLAPAALGLKRPGSEMKRPRRSKQLNMNCADHLFISNKANT
jgi:hypothetical protein